MERLAYCAGSFLKPHFGHSRLINRVKELGFTPIVSVNSDSFIEKYRGLEKGTFMGERERARFFEDLGFITIITDMEEQATVIKGLQPKVIVVGLDWMKYEILPQLCIDEQFLIDNDIAMLFLTRTEGISSTMLREQQKNEE